MKLTLDIPNNQADFFMQLIRSLNFDIRIENKEADLEADIPEWHKAILDERLAKYQTDTSGFIKWDDLKKNIEQQL